MRALALVALLALAPLPAHAQDAALARIDALVAAGRLTEARNTLAAWRRDHPVGSSAGANAQAHALYLEARLATDAPAAIDGYLAVALGHPTSPHAPAAFLRLGQGLLAAGDAPRAAAYLERLVTDYPRADERAAGFLWLARAQATRRRASDACNAATEGLRIADADAQLGPLLRIEEDEACRIVERPTEQPQRAAPAGARFAVQVGAFRDRNAAVALALRLERAGFDSRVADIPDSGLARVRVGRFATSDEAEAEARRVREFGVEAMVVNDVQRERSRE